MATLETSTTSNVFIYHHLTKLVPEQIQQRPIIQRSVGYPDPQSIAHTIHTHTQSIAHTIHNPSTRDGVVHIKKSIEGVAIKKI